MSRGNTSTAVISICCLVVVGAVFRVIVAITSHVHRGYEHMTVPALIDVLDNEAWWARRRAAEALGGMGSAANAAVPALIEALRDEDVPLRGFAAYALGNIGPAAEKAVPALVEVLQDNHDAVRRTTARALHRIDPEDYPSGNQSKRHRPA